MKEEQFKKCPFCGKRAYPYIKDHCRIIHKETCFFLSDTILNVNHEKAWDKRQE